MGFTDSYAPANFSLTNSNADGFVNTSGAPASISITGGDNGSSSFGSTKFFTTAAAAGLVSFDWNYSTQDAQSFDPFGFNLNGIFTQLTNSFGAQSQFGTASFNVALGDTFGFEVQTIDNIFGRATVTISNFNALAPTPIPTPALLPGLIGMGVAALRQRKGEALAEASEEA
jgi:hypothetical protein